MSFQYGVPQPTAAIEAEAYRLQNAVNDEIRKRTQYHSRLTVDSMIEEVISKHLNSLWEYERADYFGNDVARIEIMRYRGEVLEE